MAYDNAGNTTVKAQQATNPMTFTYDNANRIVTMLQGANLTTCTYDTTGNLTVENLATALTTNSYDNENRLTGIVNPDATRSTYTYAGDGLRRSAYEPGGVLTTFIWDGDDYLGEV